MLAGGLQSVQPGLYRWEDLDQWDEGSSTSPAFLEKVAQDIKERHQKSLPTRSMEWDGVEYAVPQFPSDLDSIWRVKVKVIL